MQKNSKCELRINNYKCQKLTILKSLLYIYTNFFLSQRQDTIEECYQEININNQKKYLKAILKKNCNCIFVNNLCLVLQDLELFISIKKLTNIIVLNEI